MFARIHSVVPDPLKFRPRVSDSDVDTLFALEGAIADKLAIKERICDGILDKLGAGAEVGSPHRIERKIDRSGPIQQELLLIDGVVRYRRLIGSSIRLQVRSPGSPEAG